MKRVLRFLYLLWFAPVSLIHGVELELTSPRDYQVVQRATPNSGTLRIVGQLSEDVPQVAFLEARLSNDSDKVAWQRLDARISGRDVSAHLEARAGGWKKLEVRVINGKAEFARASVQHVGIGEVFVIAGQSNSANHGEEKLTPKTDRVVAMDGTNWQIAKDPQPGASGKNGSFIPAFGEAVVERIDVPVGIIACGIGATSVREWLPKGSRFKNPPTLVGRVEQSTNGEWTSKGEAFDILVKRMKELGPYGFRAVLWHQGESDANQKDPSRTLAGKLYREYLEMIIRESRRVAGWDVPWFVAQASYHTPGDEASADIRQAQASLWKDGIAWEGPDTDALKGELRERNGQGVHFSAKGLRVHGEKWAEKVLPWIDRPVTSEITVRSDFEGGNVEVVGIDEASQTLRIMPALREGRGWPCWWSMRIEGLDPGSVLSLEVQAQTRPYSEKKILDGSWCQPQHAWLSHDGGVNWSPSLSGNLNSTKQMVYKIPVTRSELHVAWGPPFVTSDAEKLLQDIADRVPGSKRFELAKTRGRRSVNGIRIGQENARHQVWVNARHHAWESGGSHVGRGFIEWIASDDPMAEVIRKDACIHFIPIMDVDNVVLGAGGKDAQPRDHNRDWADEPIYPEVAAAQKMIRVIHERYGLDVYIDLHNPGSKDPVFFYGPFGYGDLQGIRRKNYQRWIELAAKYVREPVAVVPEYRFATYVTTEEERGRMSSGWVRNCIDEDGISVTLETGWNNMAMTVAGYGGIGASVGRTLAEYLSELEKPRLGIRVAEGGDERWFNEKGTLIFHDAFDREEEGNLAKAIGNGWNSATADRVPHIKQADLDGGILKISSASKEAGHAAHIHHDAGFTDGGAVIRFKFPGLNKDETLQLGFVDREAQGIHAGHLCYGLLSPSSITLIDHKTGVMNLEIRKRREEFLARKETLPAALDALLKTKQIAVPWKADREWHDLALVTEDDEMRLSIDGKLVAHYRSEGFAHPLKRWFSFLVPSKVWIDDVKIWKVK